MDPYQYDTLPETFRMQVIHIWEKTIGAFKIPSHGGSPLQRARSKAMAATRLRIKRGKSCMTCLLRKEASLI